KLARSSRLVGLGGTSNVAGAIRYGLRPSGTMAHSFVQAHSDETDAFRAYARVFKEATVLLVDTYDTPRGIERAIQVAQEMRTQGTELRGIRLDSGDLGTLSALARRHLDEAGFPAMTIFVSGGLDEYKIHDLIERQQAPIDGFGVGTSLGAAGGAPTLDTVYKLVSYDGRPVRKTSTGKATWPAAKQIWRDHDWSKDVIALADEVASASSQEPLLETVM
ncbi:nicotinate phosphoribosyltransferase, partial [mine drainage metagenome]